MPPEFETAVEAVDVRKTLIDQIGRGALAGMAVIAGDYQRVIEIGCGLGLAGLAAMAKGASVLFTDYERDALAFVELNALVNFGRMPATALMDWRRPALACTFDVVLAADVAYEKRFFDPLIETFGALLKPGGRVLLGEPRHAVVVLDPVQADPGHRRVSRGAVHVVRLVVVPEEREIQLGQGGCSTTRTYAEAEREDSREKFPVSVTYW